jgi:hypothetical protein
VTRNRTAFGPSASTGGLGWHALSFRVVSRPGFLLVRTITRAVRPSVSAVALVLLLVAFVPGDRPSLASDGLGGSALSSMLGEVPSVNQPLNVPTPTASPPSVDVGQPVTFTDTFSDGNSPYTYVWSGLPSGCPTLNESSLPCTPSGSGSFPVAVNVTDSVGNSGMSSSLSFTVDPALTAGSPSANPNPVDSGVSTTISTTPANGGSGSYSYFWTSSPAMDGPGCPTGTPSISEQSFTCTQSVTTQTTYTITATYQDSNGNSVPATFTLTVAGPLTAPIPTTNSPSNSVDLPQSVTFWENASGGQPSYTYRWGGLPPGCSPGSQQTFTCTPTANGTFNDVTVNVTDAHGDSVQSFALTFTVFPELTVPTPTPSRSGDDVNENVSFFASPQGGDGSYTYSWSGLPAGCTVTTFTAKCTPTESGTSSVSVSVKDTNGESVDSGTLSYLIDPALIAPTPTATHTYFYVNQNVTFTSIPSGGTKVYTVHWFGLPSIHGCQSTLTENATSVSCTPDAANETEEVYVRVTDTNNNTVESGSLLVQISPDVHVSLPIAKDPDGQATDKADVGMTVTFSANASGGISPYTYRWSVRNLTGCGSLDGPTLACTPTSAVNYSVNLTVTDSHGFSSVSSNFTGEIFPPLALVGTAGPQTCDVDRPLNSCTAPSADVGQELSFTGLVSEQGGPLVTGGAPSTSCVHGDCFTWYGLTAAGCDNTTGAQIRCDPLNPGLLSVYVIIVDGAGASVTSPTIEIAISSDPSAGVPTSTAASVDAGQAVTFSADGTFSGGLAPYGDYHWAGLPASCSGSNLSTDQCIPSRSGVYYITVAATDANGVSAKSPPVELMVHPDMTVDLRSSAGRIAINHSVTFLTTVTQGSGGYNFTWTGLPGGCVGANVAALSCTPNVLGSFRVTVSVSDSDGATVNHSVALAVLTVVPVMPFVVTLPLAIGAGVAAAVVGLLVFFLVRGSQLRRRVRQRTRAIPPAGAAGSAPAVRPIPRTQSPSRPNPPRGPTGQGPR